MKSTALAARGDTVLRTDQIVIGISPSCVRMATLRGRAIDQFERTFIDPAQWEEVWAKGLRPLDEHLVTMMRALKVAPNCRATVVYHSPTVVADVFGVATNASNAKQAALLATRESLMGDPSSWRATQHILAHESRSADGGGRTQVLTVAEQSAALESLSAMLHRCGLRLKGAVPAKSALVVSTSKSAHKLPAEPRSAIVNLGDHTTVLASGDSTRLTFARSVEFGYGQLAEGMLRALRGNGSSEAMDRATAYEALFRFGIPQRGQLIDTARGIAAAAVLPSLQSVLQRYVVEIRQSLRFAFKEGELARANIYITGAGASIPGLAASLSAQLDLPVEQFETPRTESRSIGADEAFGDILECLEVADVAPSLVPPSIETTIRHRRVMSCLRIGVASAIALLATEALTLRTQSREIDDALAEVRPRVDGIRQRQMKTSNAALAAYSVNAAASMIANHMGEHPDWSALMGELSRLTGPQIELTEIAASYPAEAKRASVLTLRGTAKEQAEGDPLSTFLERLTASPLINSAKLVSTRTDENNAKVFLISVNPSTIPIALPWESASVEGEAP